MAHNTEKNLSAAVDNETIKVNDKGKLYSVSESASAEEAESNTDYNLAVVGDNKKVAFTPSITVTSEEKYLGNVDFTIGCSSMPGNPNNYYGRLLFAIPESSATLTIKIAENTTEDQILTLPKPSSIIPEIDLPGLTPETLEATLTCFIKGLGGGSESLPVYIDSNGIARPCDIDALAQNLVDSLRPLIFMLSSDYTVSLTCNNLYVSNEGTFNLIIENNNTEYPLYVSSIDFDWTTPMNGTWKFETDVNFPLMIDTSSSKELTINLLFSNFPDFGYYDYSATVHVYNAETKTATASNIETG